MTITINGNGTVTGVSVGGLPDGIVDAGTLASNSVEAAKIAANAVETAKIAAEAVTGAKQGPGSVIQYKFSNINQINNRHSESAGNLESTGNHIDITPTDSANLIIVGGWMNVYSSDANDQYISINNGSSSDTQYRTYTANLGNGPWIHQNFWYQQTAGTTSQMTFTVYHKRSSGSGTVYVGWSSSPGGSFANGNMMWAMEVVV